MVRRAHSELEHVVTWIALNITRTTLVVFKTITAHADISDSHKRYPQVGLALVSRPCHVGQCPTSHVTLQGPRAGTHRTDTMDRSPRVEVLKECRIGSPACTDQVASILVRDVLSLQSESSWELCLLHSHHNSFISASFPFIPVLFLSSPSPLCRWLRRLPPA